MAGASAGANAVCWIASRDREAVRAALSTPVLASASLNCFAETENYCSDSQAHEACITTLRNNMYKTIIPATDWFFVHIGHKEPVVWPLAAWGLKESGETVGLIGAFSKKQAENNETPSLSAVVSAPGRYLHRSQLTQQERELAAKRAHLESSPVA